VTIRIQGANDFPVAQNVEAIIDHATPTDLTAAIIDAVLDVDASDTHRVTAIDTTGTSGVLTLTNGVLTYDPSSGFAGLTGSETGSDSFGFTVTDSAGAETSARVSVRIVADTPPLIGIGVGGIAGYFGYVSGGRNTARCLVFYSSTGTAPCTELYEFGETVTLTASAPTGYQSPVFQAWNAGPCKGQGPVCTFVVDGPAEIIAQFVYAATNTPVIRSAILPGARSGYIGGPPITALMSVVTQVDVMQSCRLLPPDGLPGNFTYQLMDVSGQLIGEPNPLFDVNNFATQAFVFAIEPTATTGAEGYTYYPRFDCYEGEFNPISGVNSLFLSIDAAPGPDILSIGVTPSGNGIITIAESGGVSFMSAAAMNIGAGDGSGAAQDALMTVSVDTGNSTLPLNLSVCETNAAGACISERATSITRTIGATPGLFAVFVRNDPAESIPVAPATSRVFLRFTDQNGIERSSTSAAVVAP